MAIYGLRGKAVRLLRGWPKKRRPTTSTALVDFFIIGAMRSGTSSLRDSLSLHPSIWMASGEPHFFSHQYSKGFEHYHALFDWRRRYTLRGEKSPPYAVSPHVPERVAEYNRHAKIIWMLRDPVKRAVSHFQHSRIRTPEAIPVAEAIDRREELERKRSTMAYVYRSQYHKHIEYWLRFFPEEQQYIAIFEEVVSDPVIELGKVEAFLGVPHSPSITFVNSTNTRRYDKAKEIGGVSSSDMERLREVLSPTVDAMERMLGRPIPSWRVGSTIRKTN